MPRSFGTTGTTKVAPPSSPSCTPELHTIPSPALTEIFNEADTSNDGKISMEEYLTLTKNYGIEVRPKLGFEPFPIPSSHERIFKVLRSSQINMEKYPRVISSITSR